MALQKYGQSLVAGAAGSGFCSLFAIRTTRMITNAMIRKLMIASRNTP